MTRKLKAFELVALAVFAMSTVAAGGAQAATPGVLTAETYPATLSGTQVGSSKFELTGLKLSIECEIAKLAGSLANPGSSTITASPTFEKCKAFGLTSTIDTEGCDVLVHIGETLTVGGNYGGTVDLECPEGKAIKVTSGIVGNKCEIQFGTQTGLSKGEGINKAGPPKDIEVNINATGVTYKITKDEGTCPLSGLGKTFSDGDYVGTGTVVGSSGLFISD